MGAGSQVVLHERDDGKQNRKDETRNLGLQSIIHREDNEVSQIIGDATSQKQVAENVIAVANKLATISKNLQWISVALNQTLRRIYMRADKTVGMNTLMDAAKTVAENK